jgi:hypothetical protein
MFSQRASSCFPGGIFRYELEDLNVLSEIGQTFIAWPTCMAASRFIKSRISFPDGLPTAVLSLVEEADNPVPFALKGLPTSFPNVNARHHRIFNPPPLATPNPQ